MRSRMFGSKTGAWTAARMLAPMSLENFLSSCWAEKPLVVPFLGFDSCEIQVAHNFYGHGPCCNMLLYCAYRVIRYSTSISHCGSQAQWNSGARTSSAFDTNHFTHEAAGFARIVRRDTQRAGANGMAVECDVRKFHQ